MIFHFLLAFPFLPRVLTLCTDVLSLSHFVGVKDPFLGMALWRGVWKLMTGTGGGMEREVILRVRCVLAYPHTYIPTSVSEL